MAANFKRPLTTHTLGSDALCGVRLICSEVRRPSIKRPGSRSLVPVKHPCTGRWTRLVAVVGFLVGLTMFFVKDRYPVPFHVWCEKGFVCNNESLGNRGLRVICDFIFFASEEWMKCMSFALFNHDNAKLLTDRVSLVIRPIANS